MTLKFEVTPSRKRPLLFSETFNILLIITRENTQFFSGSGEPIHSQRWLLLFQGDVGPMSSNFLVTEGE
jgi:hypothetical protein